MSDVLKKLVDVMQDDLRWHNSLAAVLENKLDAMRCRDLSRLEALGITEQQLLGSISANETKRADAARQATVHYYPDKPTRQPATARELAQMVPEPLSEKLLAISTMLIEVMQKVRRLNRINKIATQKILGHVDQIFKIIAQSGCDIGIYGRAGTKSLLEQNRLVDAIA